MSNPINFYHAPRICRKCKGKTKGSSKTKCENCGYKE
jgi:hypothetical protein